MELMNNLMATSIVLAALAMLVGSWITVEHPEWESNRWLNTVMNFTLLSSLVIVSANLIIHIWI